MQRDAVPEVIEAVTKGELSISAAAEFAKQPKDKQVEQIASAGNPADAIKAFRENSSRAEPDKTSENREEEELRAQKNEEREQRIKRSLKDKPRLKELRQLHSQIDDIAHMFDYDGYSEKDWPEADRAKPDMYWEWLTLSEEDLPTELKQLDQAMMTLKAIRKVAPSASHLLSEPKEVTEPPALTAD